MFTYSSFDKPEKNIITFTRMSILGEMFVSSESWFPILQNKMYFGLFVALKLPKSYLKLTIGVVKDLKRRRSGNSKMFDMGYELSFKEGLMIFSHFFV